MQRFQDRLAHRRKFGLQQLVHIAPQRLAARVPVDLLGARIPVRDPVLGVAHDDHIVAQIEQVRLPLQLLFPFVAAHDFALGALACPVHGLDRRNQAKADHDKHRQRQPGPRVVRPPVAARFDEENDRRRGAQRQAQQRRTETRKPGSDDDDGKGEREREQVRSPMRREHQAQEDCEPGNGHRQAVATPRKATAGRRCTDGRGGRPFALGTFVQGGRRFDPARTGRFSRTSGAREHGSIRGTRIPAPCNTVSHRSDVQIALWSAPLHEATVGPTRGMGDAASASG